jgi:hypothetical protein
MVKVRYVESTSETLKILNKLVNIAAHSVKIKKLITKEPYKDYEMRPQLHILISAPSGEMKSTILREISQYYPSKIITDLTFPSLVGSIDRTTKQIIPAAVWECRNKLMLLDEYTSTRESLVTRALLQLLEDQYYSRKIATYSADLNEEDGDLFFKVKSGNIEVKTRFSCIIATMRNIERAGEQVFRALVSRCTPIRYEMSEEEIKQVLEGRKLIYPEKFDVEEIVEIPTEEYKRIIEVVSEEIKRSNERNAKQVLARTVGDCCRVFAVLGKHDEGLYRTIVRLKVRYAPRNI